MERRSRLRDHHAPSQAKETLHAAVGKHGDAYKDLFQKFISSDISFKSHSAHEIVESLKSYALTESIDTQTFAIDMNARSISALLLAASCVASSRVSKVEGAGKRWSISRLARVEPSISQTSVITSKRHLKKVNRLSAEFEVRAFLGCY